VNWRPAKVVLDVADAAFAGAVRAWAEAAGVTVQSGDDGATRYDDIVVLGADAELCERAFPRMANGAILNLVLDRPLDRTVAVDIGRMHYDHLLVVGTDTGDLAAAYTPVRTQLKPGGRCWILGAAGPMGQMHLLRALSMPGQTGQDRGFQPARRAHGAGAQAVCAPRGRVGGGNRLPLARRVCQRGRVLAGKVARVGRRRATTTSPSWRRPSTRCSRR
jgi:hypothetical protein